MPLFNKAWESRDLERIKAIINMVSHPSTDFLDIVFTDEPSQLSIQAARLVLDRGVNINQLTSGGETLLGFLVRTDNKR